MYKIVSALLITTTLGAYSANKAKIDFHDNEMKIILDINQVTLNKENLLKSFEKELLKIYNEIERRSKTGMSCTISENYIFNKLINKSNYTKEEFKFIKNELIFRLKILGYRYEHRQIIWWP